MAMKIFYGWVIVGVGIVVTCVGFGAMLSLSVFLQPMSEAMGWSRTGISTAALLNFLCMGVGSFFWGALSDRFGTRAVVLLRRRSCSASGMVMASQAATLGQFQLLFGVLVGVAAGSFYAPLTATTTRWFTRASQPRGRAGLGGARPRLHDDRRRSRAGSSPTTTGARPCS